MLKTPVKTRIYLVDDHALIRRGVVSLLAAEPDLDVCGQGEEAAPAMSQIMQLQPDVAIVDISLRGNSGLELIKSIKAFNANIQVIVLSMHHESVYALRALKAGAHGYVMKQEDAPRLVEAVRRVRDGQLFVSENVSNQMLNRLVNGTTGDDASPVAALSDRELEVVNLIGQGMLTREIAGQLHVSIKTVETHRAHIKEKLGLRNATQLVQFCVRWVEENNSGAEPLSAGSSRSF